MRTPAPNDAQAVRGYTQRYDYDPVGNLLRLSHRLSARHSAAAWTRQYHYSNFGNRLRGTAIGAALTPEFYPHDELGRITAMPHLDAMSWDEQDQLVSVRRGTMTLHFQYVDGARIRKWVEKGGTTEERVYLGGVEFFRKSSGGTVKEETTTEHVPGGLLVETKTRRDGKDVAQPKGLLRYQLGNHLGSVSLELDADGGVISYEEYHPYGTTSYRAVREDVDAEVNRYRFTGMERDEETGLAQHGARYYAGWLGRWVSGDPIGLGGGINRYAYCRGSPVTLRDTGGHKPELAAGAGTLVTTGRGSGGRGPTLLSSEGDEQFEAPSLAVEGGGADWYSEAVEQSAHDRAVIDGMTDRINAARNRGGSWMLTYASILMAGASGGGVLAAGSWVARGVSLGFFAFDVDQTQAAIRSDWTGETVHSGFHNGVAEGAVGLGASAETSEDIATGAEVVVGLAQLAPAVVGAGRNVLTKAQRLARQRGAVLVPWARGTASASEVERFVSTLPWKRTPTGSTANAFEISHTGPRNFTVTGGGTKFDIDGYRQTVILDAKHVGNAGRSPFVPGSKIPEFLRTKITGQQVDELQRLAKIIADPTNPFTHVEVITNNTAAKSFFEGLMRRAGVLGRAVVR